MTWLFFVLAGCVAQLIDGSLGMGFGLTSSTLLLTLGTSAAVASAAVHAAEIGTTLASGISHWHRENVDREILIRLAVPGGLGAVLGATFLSSIDLGGSRIYISTILLLLGFVLFYRNVFQPAVQPNVADVAHPLYLSFLGATGGFVDASGGGGWGPVVTPTLLATTRHEPRKVIGTVSAAEFIVALCASLGFLLNIRRLDIDWTAVGGLALGGVLMAPIAAKLVSSLPRRPLGIAVAVGIIAVNAVRLLGA
ncbi:MAG TPA: sulfite exporter TauE/SafE family protein [Verrucomicrobiota bacterium]|nr:sulfite exporter TauE/SafE family protein [Verrucomicrobiota bacterium]HRZ36707.1 sulfite exporter TauE/SafE family protein [Candidatus Paceibacterota bacterium]